MPLLGPTAIVFFCGGPKNSGYLPYTFLSPFVWLCVTRRLRETGILFSLAVLFSALYTAMEPVVYHTAVDEWHLVSEMDATWIRWHYWINLVQLASLIALIVVSLLLDLAPQLKAYEEVEMRLAELAQKLSKLQLDDIEAPNSASASQLEQRLYAVVVNMRQWKPYIPSVLFMEHSDDEDHDDEEDKDCKNGGAVFSTVDVGLLLHVPAAKQKISQMELESVRSSSADESYSPNDGSESTRKGAEEGSARSTIVETIRRSVDSLTASRTAAAVEATLRPYDVSDAPAFYPRGPSSSIASSNTDNTCDFSITPVCSNSNTCIVSLTSAAESRSLGARQMTRSTSASASTFGKNCLSSLPSSSRSNATELKGCGGNVTVQRMHRQQHVKNTTVVVIRAVGIFQQQGFFFYTRGSSAFDCGVSTSVVPRHQ